MNAVMPRWPASGLALANTMNRPASCALVIQSFRPVSDQSASRDGRARGQGERVAAGTRLRQRVRADRVGGEPRQIAPPEIFGAPAQERVHDERVLDVHEHGHGRVHARERLHGEHGVEEARAASAKLFRGLDAHDAERKQPVNAASGAWRPARPCRGRSAGSRGRRTRTRCARNSRSSSDSAVSGGWGTRRMLAPETTAGPAGSV